MLYYKLRNGKIVNEYDVNRAFEIATGETYTFDSSAYAKWLFNLCGTSIIKAMDKRDVSIEELIKGNNIIEACRVYRDCHGCSLREAKEAVDKLRADMLKERM